VRRSAERELIISRARRKNRGFMKSSGWECGNPSESETILRGMGTAQRRGRQFCGPS
jgi:hypothetical protein